MSSSKATHIRVTLNRPLTWAEREGLGEELEDYLVSKIITGYSVEKQDRVPKVLNVYSMHASSRLLYDIIHYVLGNEFVNVYIKSVQTLNPKVKV